MGEYDRLTSTFRFRTGSNKLDERAKLDLERLAKYLEDMPEGTSVTLAGFADNVGAFEPNLDLSQRRADRVREELLRVGGDRLNGITIERKFHQDAYFERATDDQSDDDPREETHKDTCCRRFVVLAYGHAGPASDPCAKQCASKRGLSGRRGAD